MSSVRVFFIGGVTSFRALFGWLSPWIYIPTLVVGPIFQILLFAFIGRQTNTNSDEFYVIGNALQYTAIPCIFAMGHTIEGERYQQTLGYVLVTPAKRIPLFLGRSLPVIVNGAFASGVALVVGGLILRIHVPLGAVLPIAVVVLLTAASCTGLGLMIAAIGFLVRETATLNNIVFGLLLIFSGANVKLDVLPPWMSTSAQGLPLTHGIEAARKLADGASFSSVLGLIGAEALVGGSFAVVGYGLIRSLEALSRSRATLERA